MNILSKTPVLIIDDVPEMRVFMEQLIHSMERFRVSGSCGNGAEARLELTRRRPSLVLLDEIMPGESGLDLLQEFVGEGIPVVLMTGVENPAHAVPAGAKLRLVKPGWDGRGFSEDVSRIERELLKAMGLDARA